MESDQKVEEVVDAVEAIEVADENTLYVLHFLPGVSFALRRREINLILRQPRETDNTSYIIVSNWEGKKAMVVNGASVQHSNDTLVHITAFKVQGATTYNGKRFVFPALCDTRSVFDVPELEWEPKSPPTTKKEQTDDGCVVC